MPASRPIPAALRQLAAVSAPGGGAVARFATGHDGIDAAFDGGLAQGRLHELYADDAAAGGGVAAMLALCARPGAAPLLWIRSDDAERVNGRLHAPGFAELGGDPAGLFLARARDAVALLRAAGDATRCRGIGAVVAELAGPVRAYDLTASRKLVLAAERSGVTLIVLRTAAAPVPSAAETRWRVAAAPSRALEADAPGHPAFDLELLRRRAGPAGQGWRVEWDRDRRSFAEPPLPGVVVPLSAGAAPGLRRAG